MDTRWLNIGFIRKPHGLKGYLRIQSLSDAPDRFKDLDRVDIEFKDGRRVNYEIAACRPERDSLLMKFKGIDTPEEADRLRGAYLQVPVEEAAALPEDAFYVFEMINCQVFSEENDLIGRVRDVWPMPANDIIVIDTPDDGEMLVPAIRDIVLEVSPEEKRMVIRLIPGLMP